VHLRNGWIAHEARRGRTLGGSSGSLLTAGAVSGEARALQSASVTTMAHDNELQAATEVANRNDDNTVSTPEGSDPEAKPRARATGFALMNAERRKAIASAGGKAAHARGTAHRFDSQAASEAGRRAHQRGTAHVWTPEAAREAGRKGGRAARKRAQAAAAASGTPSNEGS
jgi:general stress protein YciG